MKRREERRWEGCRREDERGGGEQERELRQLKKIKKKIIGYRRHAAETSGGDFSRQTRARGDVREKREKEQKEE